MNVENVHLNMADIVVENILPNGTITQDGYIQLQDLFTQVHPDDRQIVYEDFVFELIDRGVFSPTLNVQVNTGE